MLGSVWSFMRSSASWGAMIGAMYGGYITYTNPTTKIKETAAEAFWLPFTYATEPAAKMLGDVAEVTPRTQGFIDTGFRVVTFPFALGAGFGGFAGSVGGKLANGISVDDIVREVKTRTSALEPVRGTMTGRFASALRGKITAG